MDYLTRMIAYATDNWPFQYHPLCKGVKLNHLMFADDLLMFCKGNAQSIMLLIRAFSSFSRSSGLTMNNTKSEVYYNGVASELKNDIQQATSFVEGSLPFRYLGVPIQAGRLTKLECNALVERMVNRIRSIGAKKLSYAGRVVLINSFLNTLYSYWAGMFIIPKGVIRRIEGICRNYLWDGSYDYHKVPLVAWDKVTLPKDEAGVAWSWKSICKVKEMMKTGYQNDHWASNLKGYSIGEGYEWLRNKQPKKDWVQLVWNDWNLPKHALISWLVMNQGLNIKAKLFQFGCCPDNRCCILDAYTSSGRSAGARLKLHTYYLLWSACFYHIWNQRNNSRVNMILTRPETLVIQIMEDAMRRIRSKIGRTVVNDERTWLQK
ncbi:uncharacterized protein LOC141614100 [Silene latifolia]|uniref:uncharacterized protein LOC141614100 n=1 Tax=Silene latifolia TaxID=37657 RepID=UPI003D770F30